MGVLQGPKAGNARYEVALSFRRFEDNRETPDCLFGKLAADDTNMTRYCEFTRLGKLVKSLVAIIRLFVMR
jgi:hypothetical protein